MRAGERLSSRTQVIPLLRAVRLESGALLRGVSWRGACLERSLGSRHSLAHGLAPLSFPKAFSASEESFFGITTRQVASLQKHCIVLCSGDGPRAALALARAAMAAVRRNRSPERSGEERVVRQGQQCWDHTNVHGRR